jgi:hypothetical protein
MKEGMMELEHPEDALPGDFVDGVLTRAEAAVYLSGIGVARTKGTLARLYSTTDDGPPCFHRGRLPCYDKRALHVWAMRQLTLMRRGSRERALLGAPARAN